MTAEEQDKYFLDILNALYESEKAGAIEYRKKLAKAMKRCLIGLIRFN